MLRSSGWMRCTDQPCASAVSADLTKWAEEFGKDPEFREQMMKPTEEQSKQMADVAKQLTDCMMRAMSPVQTAPQPTP